MSTLTGWHITEWAAALAAFVTACSVVWVKVIRPLIGFARRLKLWMDRIETAVELVEHQMKPNSGKTLFDRAKATAEVVEKLTVSVDQLQANVTMLLEHDAERDTTGRRYGPTKGDTDDR
jgi:hypothetical protein